MSLRITSSEIALQNPLSDSQMKLLFTFTLKSLKGTSEYKTFSKKLGVPKSVELHFCDDREMRSYQKRFRKLDRTTDVLSFPSLESPSNSEKNFLGSIIVSLPSVKKNAKRYKKTFQVEMAAVCVHGILHLFGFDHVKVSKLKRERMRKIQKEILSNLLDLINEAA
ncbi:MAG: rRNA maturation RNase YbeY [Bdellovibrionota bacterium]